jgi:RES domain-containing protein
VITAWRLCERKWVATAFDGRGAELFPGRWNIAGGKVVYTAETRSLAALETLVNAEDKELLSSAQWAAIPVEIEEGLMLMPGRFPDDRRNLPAPASTRQYGGHWLRRLEKPVLRVPSVVTLGEWNYLLNPLHPEFGKLRIGKPSKFVFDGRLAH